jgi:hypothetical protein
MPRRSVKRSSKKSRSRVYRATDVDLNDLDSINRYARKLTEHIQRVEEQLDAVYTLIRLNNPQVPQRRKDDMERNLKQLESITTNTQI